MAKNKIAPPFKVAETQILSGKGFNRSGEIIELGLKQKRLEKSGAWYSYQGEKIGQGRQRACQYLVDHPDVMQDIERVLREKLLPPVKQEQTEAESWAEPLSE